MHCVPDPATAVAEIARCLKPGGRLVGEFAVRGQLRRANASTTVLRATGTFGPAGTVVDAQLWLTEAGLAIDVLECTDAIMHRRTPSWVTGGRLARALAACRRLRGPKSVGLAPDPMMWALKVIRSNGGNQVWVGEAVPPLAEERVGGDCDHRPLLRHS
nr:class I SAM-dependent methyltransferase [Mycolicibacterium komossense]